MTWLHFFLNSRDLGVLRPDGYAQIIGRIKEMIIRGGENIYPTEIENFLMELPGIIEAQVRSFLEYVHRIFLAILQLLRYGTSV